MMDFRLRVTTRKGAFRTDLKQAMAKLLGDRYRNGQTRYLFSDEPLLDQPSEWVRLRLLTEDAPKELREIAMSVPVECPEAGQEIEISAWVGIKHERVNSRLADSGAGSAGAAARIEVERVARSLSSAVDIAEMSPVASLHLFDVLREKQRNPRFNQWAGKITLSGRVQNPDLLNDFMASGIGNGKAYGFGLLHINSL